MAEVVILPKYGMLKESENDKKLTKEMERRGYYVFMDMTTAKIWMKKDKLTRRGE